MGHADYINADIPASPKNEVRHRDVSGAAATYSKQDSFKLEDTSREYNQQFYSMYQYRLAELKSRVDANAFHKWGHNTKKVNGQTVIHRDKILDISSGQLCWVSGTVFCDLSNKLNILQDVEKGTDDVLPKAPSAYTGKGDLVVMIEDESGRAIINNDVFLSQNILVTGCVVAVLGMEVQAGIFEIMDIVYPTISPQKPISSGSGKIALMSGLDIQGDADYDLKIELLKQYLGGEIGGNMDHEVSRGISEVIIAGNLVGIVEEEEHKEEDFISTNNYGSKNTAKFNNESLKVMNRVINDLVATIPVTILPGNNDPAEICLPQQTLHPSLFGTNKQYVGGENFRLLTNPSWIEMKQNGLRMLGTSGQNIDDVMKYLREDLKDEEILTKLMKATIKWQNICPTAPDTLYCYPFENYDPFVLNDETPHVYFVGNQEKYASELVEIPLGHDEKVEDTAKVKLISVPRFSSTGEIVILDIETLETEVIKVEI